MQVAGQEAGQDLQDPPSPPPEEVGAALNAGTKEEEGVRQESKSEDGPQEVRRCGCTWLGLAPKSARSAWPSAEAVQGKQVHHQWRWGTLKKGAQRLLAFTECLLCLEGSSAVLCPL